MRTMQRLSKTLAAGAIASIASAASATIVPFTEQFTDDASNWRDFTGLNDLDWIASGGPDGSSHASGPFNFADSLEGDTPVILRAQDEFNSSDNAFVGDWIADNVTELSFSVRHDAPVPLSFFTRISGPANFPGAIAVAFAPVLPGAWTDISIAIDESNPQFISFEGTDFVSVFSNVGHLQIGVEVPASLAGQDAPFNFDIDNVTIVPAPSPIAGLALASLLAARRRR